METADGADAPEEPALHLRFAGRLARIRCGDAGSRGALEAVYHPLLSAAGDADVDFGVHCEVNGAPAQPRFLLSSAAGAARAATGLATFLAIVDEELAIGFQRLRPDLLFLHAAALELDGRAFLLVAPSGGGKSTTAWVLVHHDFRYLSDELAPVELEHLAVHPYPRALGLKAEPPAPYGLPAGTLVCGRNAWITSDAVPVAGGDRAMPLAAIFFVDRRPARAPGVRSVPPSEAAVRLYVNALNPLAHPADGLDAVVGVALRTPCFELPTARLAETPRLVRAALDPLP